MISDYLSRIADGLRATDGDLLQQIAQRIIATKKTSARIFTAGNGGSASTASHFCNDLIKGCRVDGRMGFLAQCLSDPMAVTTCLANDYGYDEIFRVQLQTHARRGDLLIVFSGSGNSPNVLKAAEFARARGMFVIGFGGRDGGKMKALCDLCLVAPTDSMEELEDLHLCYCHGLVDFIRGELADVWDIEVVNYPKPGGFRYALFDFDGTVSLLREGWQDVMIPYFCEILPGEEALVTEFVDMLTGKQTIFQCMRLAEEVEKRGGTPLDPYEYKAEYLRRLMARIDGRHAALKSGKAQPSDYIVPGAVDFLKGLRARGVKLYLASGTDEVDVRAEAELLGVSEYFDGGIHGAKDSVSTGASTMDVTKETVIRKMMEDNGISGGDLISFGDGYVEVQLVKDIGGYAVAVATDEERRKGVNAWKRKRLLSAHADVVVPDFSEPARLIAFMMGEC